MAVVEEDLDKLYYADEPEEPSLPRKQVPFGDVYEAARAGDVKRLKFLLEQGVNVNARDNWDSVALYYACLAGHLDAAQMLLENGAICSEHTFDGDRCHYAALNLDVRRLLKIFEARPPPLGPLPDALRILFFRSGDNSKYLDPTLKTPENSGEELSEVFPPDIVFYVDGKPISAHRAILAARCPYFAKKFRDEWKNRREVRFARNRLSFPALFSLVSFFYTDRLDVAVDDMKDLLKICKACGYSGLTDIIDKEMVHHKYAAYKSLAEIDDSQKRFILQGSSSLPQDQRLHADLDRLFVLCLHNSDINVSGSLQQAELSPQEEETSLPNSRIVTGDVPTSLPNSRMVSNDFADLYFVAENRNFRCHSSILAARSDYIRARISRTNTQVSNYFEGLLVLEENDLTAATFEKLLHYMYTDSIEELDFDQAEEMLDAASRYLLFPLKRAVADIVLPRLENASPAEVCRWLLVADMYGVWKMREYCLDSMAVNFEIFAGTPEFRYMLRRLPPPSGDASTRTTAPHAPGGPRQEQDNLLDDLREKWLEAEAAELDKRDESARYFDRRLELLIEAVEHDNVDGDV